MSPEGSTFLFERCPRGVDRKRLRAFAKRLRNEVAQGGGFTCLLTGDERLHELNRAFLGRDYATDVLSFPSTSPNGWIGEMAISCERAAAQAAAFGHTFEDEIEILMLHGVLHLMGMDHERDRGRMARAEENWRRKLGLASALIARARRRR